MHMLYKQAFFKLRNAFDNCYTGEIQASHNSKVRVCLLWLLCERFVLTIFYSWSFFNLLKSKFVPNRSEDNFKNGVFEIIWHLQVCVDQHLSVEWCSRLDFECSGNLLILIKVFFMFWASRSWRIWPSKSTRLYTNARPTTLSLNQHLNKFN